MKAFVLSLLLLPALVPASARASYFICEQSGFHYEIYSKRGKWFFSSSYRFEQGNKGGPFASETAATVAARKDCESDGSAPLEDAAFSAPSESKRCQEAKAAGEGDGAYWGSADCKDGTYFDMVQNLADARESCRPHGGLKRFDPPACP